MNADRLVRLVATGLVAGAFLAGTSSCVPPEGADAEQPKVEEKPKPPPSEDIVIDDLSEIKLTGALYAPEGMGSPGMARVRTDNRPLARQRRTFSRARGDKKVEEARYLASMLSLEARKPTNDSDTEKALKEEIRQVVSQTLEGMGEQSDAVLLQMLFATEWQLGNQPAAIEAGAKLLAQHSTSSLAGAAAPWLAYAHLSEWNTEAAAAITQGWDLSAEGMNYTHAYVAAWVAFRTGDGQTARTALMQAARNWKVKTTWPAIERDLSLFMAHTGAPVDEAVAAIMELAQDTTTQYYWLYQTNEEYAKVGRFAEASELLDAAKEVAGAEMKASDLVTFRNKQYNYELVELNADKSADYAIETYQAVQQCGEPCAGQAGAVAKGISQLAQFNHNIYSSTIDDRFYAPAKKLYEFYLTLGQPDTETLRTYLNRLEETKKLASAAVGKHNKAIMDSATSLGRPDALKGCYEGTLQANPTLVGVVAVTIDVDPKGAVSAVATEPAAGEEGLGAVAACMQEEVRSWQFPGRSLAGTTRVLRSYSFAPDAPPAAPAAPAPEEDAGEEG
ncbi:AgmX/PglI C-terminal domain-containing protein [Haliangium sp.]|uniref:AgmX/PglI C-terminal domain-containing protein n=1 Tax=Haliangium sp. TaxID=2663208 RepID=UPI003D12F1CF